MTIQATVDSVVPVSVIQKYVGGLNVVAEYQDDTHIRLSSPSLSEITSVLFKLGYNLHQVHMERI